MFDKIVKIVDKIIPLNLSRYKKMYFVMGIIVGLIFAWVTSVPVGFCMGVVLVVLKEVWDQITNGDFDKENVIYSVLGIAIGCLLMM